VAQKIWETPELALEEKKSSAALAAELEDMPIRPGNGQTGMVIKCTGDPHR
jgi:metal-dependent amidase/aminoacylase/carboxypeptidase family protein